MRVYISGPISGVLQGNKSSFTKLQKKLESKGHTVVNPHEICAHIHKGSAWSIFMKECIRHLVDCDAIVMLPSWEASRGANIELKLALDLGIEVMSSC